MKKIFLLFLCIFSAIPSVSGQSANDERLRDSIFLIFHTMPADTTRLLFIKNEFLRHIKEDWSLELLDSALLLAQKRNDAKNEISFRYERFRYYTFRMDGTNMSKALTLLKENSYRYHMYDDYFLALHYMLQLKSTQGDTEYAILESQKMRKEAVRLKNTQAEFLSYVTEGRAYSFARKPEKAIELYKQALALPQLSAKDELMVHGYLASSYYILDKYEGTIAELEARRKIIDHIIEEQPALRPDYQNTILEIELMYCKIYLAKLDTNNLKIHLDEAAKFYNEECFSSISISYQFSWAGYYYLKKDWNKCFPQFELTLSYFKGSQPMYEADIRRIMGDAYMDAGQYQKAAETYKTVVLKCDSVNKATLRMNEETIQANYRIEKALLEKEITRKRFWEIAVGATIIFFILLIWGVLHLLRVQKKLRLSEKEMYESYALAKAADKMKDVFLHNITNEIREPLNTVVTLSDSLCQNDHLPIETRQEYSMIIKRSSEKLIDLIFNILDLSRLESGMMKFNVQEYDIVQLCKDAKLMIEMHERNKAQVDFRTDLESLLIQVDTIRFMKLLSSVLIPSKGSSELCKVTYTLTRETNDYLKIVVENSPLLRNTEKNRSHQILHDINRLYLETFNGTYLLYQKENKQLIIITYPIIYK